MRRARILYLSASCPWPIRSGEAALKVAHLEALAREHEVVAVCIDNERTDLDKDRLDEALRGAETIGVSLSVQARPSRPADSLRGKLALLGRILVSPHPWHGAMVESDALRVSVAARLGEGFDLVVVDHLNSLPLLPDVCPVPVLVVLHDDTRALARDLSRITAFPRRLVHAIDAYKADRLQRRLVAHQTPRRRVCAISARDARDLEARYGAPVPLAQAVLPPRTRRWSPSTEPVFVFSGPVRFPPNAAAIAWLARELAPALAAAWPQARIAITGTQAGDVDPSLRAPNVDYLGYLSRDALEERIVTARAVLCPIVHGSGVKIKILEALAHGVPVLATPQSAGTVAFVSDLEQIFLDDVAATLDRILALRDESGFAELAGRQTRELETFISESPHRLSELARTILSSH